MRITLLAASSALLLVACGDTTAEKQAAGLTENDVKSKLADAPTLRPGQYESSFQITRFDVPGVPAEAQAQLRQMMTSAAQVQQSYCLTEEQAERGAQDMFRELSKTNGECQFDRFDVDGNQVEGRLTCVARGGGRVEMAMSGTMADTSSEIEMTANITDPNMPQGRATMVMTVASRRTGDCTAESRAAAE